MVPADNNRGQLESPSVAVVILNWNGKSLLERFLPSVLASTYKNLQVIVGDNASTDDSLAFVETHFPEVKLIRNAANYGFAEGYNQILSQVKTDYFILLNSDVEVPPYWIEPLIETMTSDVRIAVAQPKIKWQLQKGRFEYAGAAGGYIDKYGFPFCRGRIFDEIEDDHGQYDNTEDIFWASGAALFIKREAWEIAGGFDANLFAHMEEIDLCWRLKNRGYRVICCAGAEVYHVGAATLAANNPRKTYLNFRNNLIILYKNLPSNEVFKVLFIRFWLDLAAWIRFLIGGKFKHTIAISKAHFHFLTHLSKHRREQGKQALPFLRHQGVYNKSIVYQYFIRKITLFSRLPR